MKYFYIIIQLTAAFFLYAVFPGNMHATVAPHPDWTNSLVPEGTPGAELTLAESGIVRYDILLPASPTAQEEDVADELKKWLDEMTGGSFNIVKEGASQITPNVISVGRTNLLAGSGLSVKTKEELEDEGYEIAVSGLNLFLVGGKNGPLSAVLAFLEEDLGCRWYARSSAKYPVANVIPNASTLRFRPVSRFFKPVFELRDVHYWDAIDEQWALHNRTRDSRLDYPEPAIHYFVHTFSKIVPPYGADKYFKNHPEYYSLFDGGRGPYQLCLTNSELYNIALSRAKGVLSWPANNNVEILSFSQNDNNAHCQCDKCNAINQPEGSDSGTILTFVNRIAEDISQDYPDIKVSTLAYNKTLMPPKTIRPNDNVIIRLCTLNYQHPFLFVNETDEFQAALKAWSDIGADIYIWDYTIDFGSYLSPMPNMQVVAENIKFYRQYNVKRVMLQGPSNTPGTARSSMRSWVWSKLLWNPDLDTQALIKDFTYGYYGKAAEPMQRYNELLWSTWESHHSGPTAGLGNPIDANFSEQAIPLFEQAKNLATTDLEIVNRIELAKLPVLYTQITNEQNSLDCTNENQVKHYFDMIDEFETISKNNGVIYLHDGHDVDEYLKIWRSLCIICDVTPETVVAEESDLQISSAANVVEDDLACNKFGIYYSGCGSPTDCWFFSWPIPTDKLDPSQKYYELNVIMRANKVDSKGNVFRSYVRRGVNGIFPILPILYSPSDFIDNNYKSYNIGVFTPHEDDKLALSISANSVANIKDIYVDRVELIHRNIIPSQPEISGTVSADDIEPLLYRKDNDVPYMEHGFIIADKLADNGFAIRQPCGETYWPIRWAIPFDELGSDQKYLLRVSVRTDKEGNEGTAFHSGVKRNQEALISKEIPASDIADRYQWFDIGVFEPNKDDYVYVTPSDAPDANFTTIYTDRIELVPIPAFTSKPIETASEDTLYSYDITAIGEDGTTLTITAPVLPTWLTLTDNGDGTATLIGTPSETDVGNHDVQLELRDSQGNTQNQVFSIKVDPPEPPDCNGDLNGSATIDNCGQCVSGNTGQTACVDINNDGKSDLYDVIVILKVLSGTDVDIIISGDGKIGLQEVIYILQSVSEIRK